MAKIKFQTQLHKFDKKGEKTGWTYIDVTAEQANQIKPDVKKSFRIKGKIDAHKFSGLHLLPMGDGDFILSINADIRKAIKKQKGDVVVIEMEFDSSKYELSTDLMTCLKEDKKAMIFFNKLPPSHQNYFSKWIESAKSIETKTKRLSQAMYGFSNNMNYPEVVRHFKKQNEI